MWVEVLLSVFLSVRMSCPSLRRIIHSMLPVTRIGKNSNVFVLAVRLTNVCVVTELVRLV